MTPVKKWKKWMAVGCSHGAEIDPEARAVTIIGVPFAIQHIKLAAISLAPIGKTIVKKHLAEAAQMQDAHAELRRIRNQ